jgi:Outer membrane protein
MRRLILAVAVMACFSLTGSVQAQAFKFGHINVQQVISLMPEKDSAEVKLKNYGTELSGELETLQTEFNNKYQTYLQKKDGLTPAIRDAKEKELQDLQQRIQEFQTTAQEDYQKMQSDLFKPILDKANDAIKKVAKVNGFTYIYDIGTPGIVYYSDTMSIDITSLVKKELGITK